MKKLTLLFSLLLLITELKAQTIDREYTLEASMLGYFSKDGTRNPTLKANKGEIVKIRLS